MPWQCRCGMKATVEPVVYLMWLGLASSLQLAILYGGMASQQWERKTIHSGSDYDVMCKVLGRDAVHHTTWNNHNIKHVPIISLENIPYHFIFLGAFYLQYLHVSANLYIHVPGYGWILMHARSYWTVVAAPTKRRRSGARVFRSWKPQGCFRRGWEAFAGFVGKTQTKHSVWHEQILVIEP